MQGFVPVRESLRAPWHPSQLHAGDWVRVRSREEVLATLDAQGCLDGMPFMPEMLAFCGRTMRVAARAHKTCDTIHYEGARKLDRTVHLEDSRCDGSAHGGCETGCLLYWCEAWLEPIAAAARDAAVPHADGTTQTARGCTVEQLAAATQRGHDAEKGPRYACQITDVLNATRPLSPYDPRQYMHDLLSGNVGVGTMLQGFVYRVGVAIVRRGERLGKRLGMGDAIAKVLMTCYDVVQRLVPNGVPFPRRVGTIPKGQPTPDLELAGLQPGSRVRVRPYREILDMLNTDNKTRGLYFDAEHVPFCGREFRVRSLVTRIVDEKTGHMLQFKTPSVILDGVYCKGTYSDHRMFCPRAINAFWRTAWLQPVEEPQPKTIWIKPAAQTQPEPAQPVAQPAGVQASAQPPV